MRFWTSYYAAIKNIPENYLLVAISLYAPDYFFDENKMECRIKIAREFAPDADLLNDFKQGKETEEGYKRRYVEGFLKKFNKDSLTDYFEKIERDYGDQYDNVVFLCYEKPKDFCHRHIFSKLLNILCGIECKEIEFNKDKETSKEVPLF